MRYVAPTAEVREWFHQGESRRAYEMLGAPVLRAEWQDIPHRLALMFTQLPGRISGIFALWR